MNREIKFKAYDKKLNRIWEWEDLKNLPLSDLGREDLVWLMSTGTKDVNGVEIYEHDIVSIPDHYDGDHRHKKYEGVIKYEDGGFYISDPKEEKWDCADDFISGEFTKKVIGNIHQNTPIIREA